MRALNSAAETYFEDFDKLEQMKKTLITSYEHMIKIKFCQISNHQRKGQVGILYYIEVVGKRRLEVAVLSNQLTQYFRI